MDEAGRRFLVAVHPDSKEFVDAGSFYIEGLEQPPLSHRLVFWSPGDERVVAVFMLNSVKFWREA